MTLKCLWKTFLELLTLTFKIRHWPSNLILTFHLTFQVCMSVCSAIREKHTDRMNRSKLLHPLLIWCKCLIHNKVCKWTGYFQEAYFKVNCNWVINYKQPVNGSLWYIPWGNQFTSFTAIVTCDNFVPTRIKVSLFDIWGKIDPKGCFFLQ